MSGMRTALSFVLGLCLGGVAASIYRAAPSTSAPESVASSSALPAPPADSDFDCEGVRAALALESEMRLRLTEEVERLEDRLPEYADEPSLEPGPKPEAAASHVSDASAHSTAESEKPWFSDSDLLALGMDPREVERIRLRWEQYTMDKLYLADARARDEKPSKGARLRELMEIERAVREDLGEESYDALLWATGSRNRVVLTDVLETSPAAAAGIRKGDEVIRYAGRRVWRPKGLTSFTRTGKRGEIVELQVLRDGELLRFFLARGPLGVRPSRQKRPPLLGSP